MDICIGCRRIWDDNNYKTNKITDCVVDGCPDCGSFIVDSNSRLGEELIKLAGKGYVVNCVEDADFVRGLPCRIEFVDRLVLASNPEGWISSFRYLPVEQESYQKHESISFRFGEPLPLKEQYRRKIEGFSKWVDSLPQNDQFLVRFDEMDINSAVEDTCPESESGFPF